MNKNIEIIGNFRKYILTRIEPLTPEQLNFRPEGFNNNIIWNLGHLNSVLQALCYKSSGLPITIDEKHFTSYLPGTKPADFIPADEIEIIKQQFIKAPEILSRDLEGGLFKNYNKVEKIEKVYNIQVESIHDALSYLTHHEGMHFNAITTLLIAIEYAPSTTMQKQFSEN